MPITVSVLILIMLVFGLITVQIISGVFRPQDQPLLEMLASQGVSLRWQINTQLGYIYSASLGSGIVLCATLFIILNFQSELDGRYVLPGLVSLFVCIFSFGNLALLATLWMCNSILGSLIGVLAVLLAFVQMPPASAEGPTFYWMFDFLDVYRRPGLWWLMRLFYLSIGVGALPLIWRMLGNTERLLRASSQGKARRRTFFQGGPLTQRLLTLLRSVSERVQSYLPATPHRFAGHIGYQTLIGLQGGRLTLFNASLVLLWFLTAVSSRKGIIAIPTGAYEFLAQYFAAFSILSPFFLTWITLETFFQNRRHALEELTLAILSPREYLFTFLMAQILAVLISVTCFSVVPFLILLLLTSWSALSSILPHIAAYSAIMLYGVAAFTVYAVGMALFLGTFIRPQLEAASKLLLSMGMWIVVTATHNSAVGHLIVPHMDMAYRTSIYWLTSAAKLPLHVVNPIGPIVDASILPLPLLSAVLQIALLWIVFSSVYTRQVRSA
ncbi:MAG: hypothetical protein IT323_06875 [Anaerolineae bacterium]|nr:hypothetical protein [Anaerolineae bacterium]